MNVKFIVANLAFLVKIDHIIESRRKWYDKNVEEKRVNQMVFWNLYGSLEYHRVKVDGFLDFTNKTKLSSRK